MANPFDVDLRGKYALIRAEWLHAAYRADRERLVRVEGGFGASPATAGSKVVLRFAADGEVSTWDAWALERLVDDEEAARIRAGEGPGGETLPDGASGAAH